MPRGLRKAGIAVVAAAAMVLAAACGPGGEGEAAPTGEELLARLVTDGDLDGDWRTDTAEGVDPGEPSPTPFSDSCEEVVDEPAWQAFTQLTAEWPEATRSLVLIELAFVGGPDEVASMYTDLRDQLARCGERKASEGELLSMVEEDVDVAGIGDQGFARHYAGIPAGPGGGAIMLDQYLAVVRDGGDLVAVLALETIDTGGADPGELPGGTLGPGDVTAAVTTAVRVLSGEVAPLTSPAASGEAVPGQAPWWNEAVFYEAFVRSFADSDGDGDGDLKGLLARLDYLNDGDPATDTDLGVTGLWLMPITQSPSYHGYDATDYYTVDTDYGTNEDFRRLVAEAHARGVAVIVDLMLNHTSSEHPWFADSATGPLAPRRDWYVWTEEDPGSSTSWGTPAWHERNGAYYLGLFWEGMPDLNYRNPDVTAQMYDVARFWLEDMGADGLRLDAVRHLIEEGEDFDGGSRTHEWLTDWAGFIDATAPDALTVGEVWDDTPVVAEYVTGGDVDVAFDFDLAGAVLASINRGDPALLDGALAGALAAYPPGQFASFLTNHDQNRVMTQLGGDEAKARLAASILLTLPGVPFVYYGEEIGMTGAKPDELIRTPMQWSAEENAGFGTGTPWEPPNEDYSDVNVAAQEGDADSLLSRYRRLVHLRAAHPALRTGGLRSLGGDCPGAYAYLRTAPDDGAGNDLLVVLNFAAEPQQGCAFTVTSAGLRPGSHEAVDLLTGESAAEVTVTDGGSLAGYVPFGTLAPRRAAIVEIRADDGA